MKNIALPTGFKIEKNNFALESKSSRVDVKIEYGLNLGNNALSFEITDKRLGALYSITLGIDLQFNMRDSKHGVTTFSGELKKSDKRLETIFRAKDDKIAYSALLDLTIELLEDRARIESQRTLQRDAFFGSMSAIMSSSLSNFANACKYLKSDIPNMASSKSVPYSIYD